MFRHVTEPGDAGGFEFGFGIETRLRRGYAGQAAGDGVADEAGTLFLQQCQQHFLLRYQGVELRSNPT
jgi:hypothetical protein